MNNNAEGETQNVSTAMGVGHLKHSRTVIEHPNHKHSAGDQRGLWFGGQPELVQEDQWVDGFLQLISQVCYLIEMEDTTWVVKVAMMSLPYVQRLS